MVMNFGAAAVGRSSHRSPSSWNTITFPIPTHHQQQQDVVWRVGSSFLGPFKPDFMEVTLTSPDLYGPFWVATTLVFVTAVAGNYAEFIAWNRESKGGAGGVGAVPGAAGNGTAPIPAPGGGTSGGSIADLQWYTDYAKMSYSAMLYYGYVFVLGMVLYFALRWFRCVRARGCAGLCAGVGGSWSGWLRGRGCRDESETMMLSKVARCCPHPLSPDNLPTHNNNDDDAPPHQERDQARQRVVHLRLLPHRLHPDGVHLHPAHRLAAVAGADGGHGGVGDVRGGEPEAEHL